MSKRRTLDSRIRTSQTFARLSYRQRDLWQGLIAIADDQGRLPGVAAFVRSQVCPFDDISTNEIDEDLQRLEELGNILRYDVNGSSYIQLVNWWKYQQPQWAGPSDFPPPHGWSDRLRYHGQGHQVITLNWEHSGGFSQSPPVAIKPNSSKESVLPDLSGSTLPDLSGDLQQENQEEVKVKQEEEEEEKDKEKGYVKPPPPKTGGLPRQSQDRPPGRVARQKSNAFWPPEILELANKFADTRGCGMPALVTKPDFAEVTKLWKNPLEYIFVKCGHNSACASSWIESTIHKMVRDQLTFSTPVQIVKTFDSLFADKQSSQGGSPDPQKDPEGWARWQLSHLGPTEITDYVQ